MSERQHGTFELTVDGVTLTIAYNARAGHLPPLVCLHGFGSTKEDYADLAVHPAFAGRELVHLDAPGFGESTISDPAALSIPFLVETAIAACDILGIAQFHLSGHSMGGLTGLMLAHDHPARVLSFIDIEGNVSPEDCFLSRQIVSFPAASPEAFLAGFIDRVSQRPEYSSALYAKALPFKVNPASVEPVFKSMVDLSDNTPLMEIFANLPCPRVFVYGEQNKHLSYLGDLPGYGVEMAEIPHSGHFPMYSNPPALWSEMATFIARCEDEA